MSVCLRHSRLDQAVGLRLRQTIEHIIESVKEKERKKQQFRGPSKVDLRDAYTIRRWVDMGIPRGGSDCGSYNHWEGVFWHVK